MPSARRFPPPRTNRGAQRRLLHHPRRELARGAPVAQRDAYVIPSVTLRLLWYDKVALAFETSKATEREALEN